jgi:hypothetical protein
VRRLLVVSLAVPLVWLGRPAPADAHRLDECLQATRVSIEIDRLTLEIDLTPGASVAAKVFGWIDTNGDQRISAAERAAYAQEVLGSVVLSADGRRAPVTLIESQFPDFVDVAAGVGTVRLRAVAKIAAATPGRHVIAYVNAHRPEASVYLANALLPSDRRIAIASQRRDPAQQMLTLEYDVAYGNWSRTLALVSGLAIVGLLGVARRSRIGHRRRTLRPERQGESIASSPVC